MSIRAAPEPPTPAPGSTQRQLTELGETATEKDIEEAVENFFLSSVTNIPLTTLSAVTPQATIVRNQITATLTYEADYQTTMMVLFGRDVVPISNRAQATVTLRS